MYMVRQLFIVEKLDFSLYELLYLLYLQKKKKKEINQWAVLERNGSSEGSPEAKAVSVLLCNHIGLILL